MGAPRVRHDRGVQPRRVVGADERDGELSEDGVQDRLVPGPLQDEVGPALVPHRLSNEADPSGAVRQPFGDVLVEGAEPGR